MNWKAAAEDTPVATLAVPTLTTRAQRSTAEADGDWLCAWCHNRVAHEQERFSYEGNNEFVFTNPEGIRFEILTFSEVIGCQQAGVPTLEFTWFPGHAWSYCHCGHCGQHLGWYYTGTHEFAGLIRGRIVRALHLRN